MDRSAILARLEDSPEEWDILVIGGGATGLGIAVDAASRGYRTALLEQADFAEGTSSRSTKLIHGGVRYLRGGQVGLVRESLRERGRLMRNAAGLVKPLAFVVPAFRWYERFFYGSGLTLYDLLAGGLGIESTGHLSASATRERIPNLTGEGLRGGTLYWDGQFDDARLAVALARTAVSKGAAVVNHVRVEGLIKEGEKVRGAVARDRIADREFRVRAKVTINATGVFTDSVRKLDEPDATEVIQPSQGIHVVLDRSFLGGDTAIMIPSTDDGRVLFVIPWRNRVLLGTTDTADVPVELHPRPLEEEIDYLLEHAGRYLVQRPKRSDVRATFAGLRPLVRPPRDGGRTSDISRTHSLFVSDSGLLTIAGGKWTTYRRMAEDAVDRACELAGLATQPCATGDLTLLDGAGSGDDGDALDPELPYTEADVRRAVREEMAMTLPDVLSRRTRCAFLDTAATARCSDRVVRLMAAELGRDAVWIEEQKRLLAEEFGSEAADVPKAV